MKKFLILVLVWVILICFLLIKNNFFGNNETEEIIKEEVVVQEKQESNITDMEGVYKMLDFDRRLILKVGPQDESLCSIFCLAYARGILDNSYNSNPYDYYDGDGAVWYWAQFEDIASSDPLSVVLQRAYDEIDKGRPTVFYVNEDYATTIGRKEVDRISDQHFVLIIGYSMSADYHNLKPSDFYVADPSGGYCYEQGCIPWAILSDNAPMLMDGEYALFSDSNKNRHVDTCLAYVDTATWDEDLSKSIFPNYIDE